MPIYELNGKRSIISPNSFVHPESVIIGDVIISEKCLIGPGAVIRADFAPIFIGPGTSIQDNAVIHVYPNLGVKIGSDVIIGHSVVLHDVVLEDRCVIGMGSILLQKVYCESDVVIAAGSVVPAGTRIQRNMLAAGNPIRIKKEISMEMKKEIAQGVEDYKKLVLLYRDSMKRL